MNAAVQFVHDQLTVKKDHPKFKAGDNITVNYKIVEGGKERIQSFRGDVIKLQGNGATASFTVLNSVSVWPELTNVFTLKPAVTASSKLLSNGR